MCRQQDYSGSLAIWSIRKLESVGKDEWRAHFRKGAPIPAIDVGGTLDAFSIYSIECGLRNVNGGGGADEWNIMTE